MLETTDPSTLLRNLHRLQHSSKSLSGKEADVILSTVHKAKGLEFDTVVLANDFVDLSTLDWSGGRPRIVSGGEAEEVNILYVAVTRAKRRLVLNTPLRWLLLRLQAWDSVSLGGLQVPLQEAPSTLPLILSGYGSTPVLNNPQVVSSMPPAHDLRGAATVTCHLCGRGTSGGCPGGLKGRNMAPTFVQGGLERDSAGGKDESDLGREPLPCLLYMGSGSNTPLCWRCVEGVLRQTKTGEIINTSSFFYFGSLVS
ncbi:unnamed protein product [Choristocarpus tenellus]